jgi:regulator of RNase E activity RraB
MNKEQVLKLLKILQNIDCLHPEWGWYEEDENGQNKLKSYEHR